MSTEPSVMPAEIAAGIVQVMATIKRLAKTEENRFQHYNYASIDDFLEAVGPLMAEAGIFLLTDEVSTEITTSDKKDREGTSSWLTIRWAFTIGHSSGSLYGPLTRSVIVPASGAQAYGSALSYALKQFMRGLFAIPTGDGDDPDAQRKEDLPSQQRQNGKASKESAIRADAWRELEDANTPKDLLSVACRVRDSKALSERVKTELLDFASERMNDYASRSVKAVTTPEQCEKTSKWYGGMWLLTSEQKAAIATALQMVQEGLQQPAQDAEPAAAS